MAQKSLKKGLFITFEGAEGSGKSTQIKLLEGYLKEKGARVLILREPGSTRFSENLRRTLLDKKNGFLSEKTELLLYLAARAQLVKEKILPAIKEKKIVLCDRFQDSTLAYQGYGLGLDKKIIELLGGFVCERAAPDLTFLLDIRAKEGLKRAGGASDRIQERPLAYHQRVRNGYLKLASQNPERIKLIPANGVRETQEEIRKIIDRLFARKQCPLNK